MTSWRLCLKDRRNAATICPDTGLWIVTAELIRLVEAKVTYGVRYSGQETEGSCDVTGVLLWAVDISAVGFCVHLTSCAGLPEGSLTTTGTTTTSSSNSTTTTTTC